MSEYDDLAALDATPAGNDYDAILQGDAQNERTQLRSNLLGAVDVNPDQYAEATRLAAQSGIPAEVVHRNLPEVKKTASVNAYDELLQSSPALRDKMSELDFARMAHDDLENAGLVEQTIASFKRGGRALASGVPSFTEGGYGLAAAGADALSRGIGDPLARWEILPADPFADMAAFLHQTRQGQRQLTQDVAGDQSKAGFVEQSVYSGFQSLGQNAVPMVAGVLTGQPGIALGGMSATYGGQEYGRAREAGLPFEQAAGYGLTQAGIEYLTEKLPVHYLFKDLGEGSSLVKMLAHNVATEVPGEQVATVLQDLNEWANLNPDKPFSDYVKARPGAAAQTLIATLVASGGQVGALRAVDMASRTMQERANKGLQDGEALAALTEQAATSKLRERSPQNFQKFVEAAAADGDVQDVYIDAKVLQEALQQSKVDPASVAPSIAQQLPEALIAGGDVRIPIGEYSARVAGQDFAQSLVPHLRTSPEAMSVAEAEAFQQSSAEQFQQEADKALATDEAASIKAQSTATVASAVHEQLKTANRFTDDVNTAYSTMVGEFYATQADKLGVTAEELFVKYPLNITAENLAGGQQLDQPRKSGDNADHDQGTKNVQRTSSVGGAAQGRPGDVGGRGAAGTSPQAVRLFRGSEVPLTREHFSPRSLGVASGHPSSGLGVFFTDSETDAARYGAVSQHTVSLSNPLRVPVEELPGFDSLEEANAWAREQQAKGHDGLIIDASHLGGRKDYVVFSPDNVADSKGNILRQDARGQISFGDAGATIALLKNADLSTFLHESGHLFLEMYTDMASQPGAPSTIAADMDSLLKWFGVKDLATWQKMSLNERRESHEKFARGFESYLFEGKSPSSDLQPLFARFRAWLLNVYKSLSALNVELTPEVRGVFDRMLASEQQIHLTEAQRNYAPLFASAADAGMTADEWIKYQELGANATETAIDELQKRGLRDMRWLSNAKARELKKLQADADSKRKAVRAEVTVETKTEPVYAAMDFIRHGTFTVQDPSRKQGRVLEIAGQIGTKLSLPTLKEMYGEGPAAPWRYLSTGKAGLAAEQGITPDLAAELFGFSSGDHLVRALLEAPQISELIDAKTDQRMLERFGDLTQPGELEKAAEAAIHNESRARFVATEIRALNRAMNPRGKTAAGGSFNVLTKAAREFADITIARKRVRDVKPGQFTAAETRAAKAAEKARAAGKLEEAAMEKRNQLVNTYASRAAQQALDDVDRGVDYLKKFERDATRKNLDVSYLDQVDALLERFDLRKGQSTAAIDKRKSLLQWVEAQRTLGFEPTIDEDLLNDARRQSYKDMTVEEFRGLIDTVKNIEHLGRLKNKLLTAQDQREFDAAVADAATAITDNAKTTVPTELEHNTFASRVKSGANEFLAMHRKLASIIRQMDGFKDGGTLWELFVRPLNKAGDIEASKRAAATKELTRLFKPILKIGHLRQKLYIPAIGTSISREGRLSIALNWGNETNRQRVLEGEKWAPAQAQAVLDTLTKDEWNFVQNVWDYIGSYWPEIAEKERRVSGVIPERVDATPVQTQFGELKGGYFPIKYDPARSTRAEADTLAESVKQAMQGLYTRATTRRGHTKARAESVQRPMRKDLGVIFEHVDQVIHDLAWHEYLIDANRLLRASAIDGAIREHYGPEVLRAMRKALDDVAAGDIPAQNAFERSINYLRTGATVAGLGWNLTTSLLQPIGLTQSMVRIGPKWVGRGLAQWIGDAARMQNTVAKIYDKSEFMKLRGQTMQREISEIRNKVGSDGKMAPVQASFFYLIQKAQMVADVPTWLGAYEKAMEQTNDDEVKAIALADQAVLDAQGGGQIKDLAQIQRGGPLMKLWTNFYSFFNTTYNLSVESVQRTDFKKPGDVGRLAVDFLLLYTVPAVLGTLLRAAMKGDDDDLTGKLIKDHLNYLLGTMVGLREIGSAVSGFDYSGPASTRFFAEVSKLVKQAEQGELDQAALKALNNVAGILFHYPAGQVQRTAQGVAAMASGDTANPGVLVTGPAKK